MNRISLMVTASAALLWVAACGPVGPETFRSPEEAMAALEEIAGTGDHEAAARIFGPEGFDILSSGDETADREDALRVKEMIQEAVAFEDAGEDRKIALLGREAWPFPVPLMRADGGWRFDIKAGREEILNRRVGRNELLALATLHAYVEAQREYASQGRDGNPPAYAWKLASAPGKHDGLYWPAEGEEESPLGSLVAAAAEEGYTKKKEEGPTPYHGYYYRILTAQGESAPGGRADYLDGEGLMTGGFAMVAWPARWGNSGVMTFQVSQLGLVFQKDLGPGTPETVGSIQAFDPDDTWEPTGD